MQNNATSLLFYEFTHPPAAHPSVCRPTHPSFTGIGQQSAGCVVS